MLELLAKKTVKKMRYWSNDDKLDCYQSGLLDMFQNWYNFNEDKSVNAFAYFTQICKNGYAKEWKKIHRKTGLEKEDKLEFISLGMSGDSSIYSI